MTKTVIIPKGEEQTAILDKNLFEKHLQKIFAKDYQGSDSFDNWLSNLDVNELIAYGNEALSVSDRRIIKRIINNLK